MTTANNIARLEERKKTEGKRSPNDRSNGHLLRANTPPNKPKKGRGDVSRIAAWMWQPGKSGNPSGRPKFDLSAEMCRAQFENDGPAIYAAINKSLRKGSPYALQVVSDRAYGKLREVHQLDVGQYQERNATNEQLERRVAELDDEIGMTELRNRVAELERLLLEYTREKPVLPPAPGGLKPM
jgi:hypothetical protein